MSKSKLCVNVVELKYEIGTCTDVLQVFMDLMYFMYFCLNSVSLFTFLLNMIHLTSPGGFHLTSEDFQQLTQVLKKILNFKFWTQVCKNFK